MKAYIERLIPGIAAVIVLFSAMFDPWVSVSISVAALLALSLYQPKQDWRMATLAFIAAILVAGGISYMNSNNREKVPFNANEYQPTTFSRIGTLVFNTPGLKPNTPYLVYENPGQPALTKELGLDELSVCAAPDGAAPCMAMSTTLDVPFGGKRARVEGIEEGDMVVVRKLQVVGQGQPELAIDPGRVFIPWPLAVTLIEQCQVTMIAQTHALDVNLTLEDGQTVVAVEPAIDEVFRIFDESNEECGNIPIATE